MLTQAVESYIDMRKATGFAFRSEGSLLKSFAAFSDAAGKQYVRSDTAMAIHPASGSPRRRPPKTSTTKYHQRFLAARRDRAPHPTSFRWTKSNASFKPHLSWVNEMLSVDAPTVRSSPCWRVPGFACQKRSISVFRTSPRMVWSFAVQSSAKAVSFPFTRQPRMHWNDTSRKDAPILH